MILCSLLREERLREREREIAGRVPFILKRFREAWTMTKLKWFFSLSVSSTHFFFLISIFPSNRLSIYVSVCFLIDTPISQRFHAWGIPNGSGLMTNRSIFIDLKVAGLENCLTIFKTAAEFCSRAFSRALSLSHGLHLLFLLLCHCHKPCVKALISGTLQNLLC